MKKLNKWMPVIESGIIVGAITFLLTFITILYWQGNGLNDVELTLMSVLAGFILLLSQIIVNITVNRKRGFKTGESFKKRYIVLIVFSVSFVTYITLDSLYFLYDDSLSLDYISFLNDSITSAADKVIDVYPFGLFNSFVTVIIGFIGTGISAFLIKKNKDVILENI